MIDDAQLLRQYLEARSETAFAEIVERHIGMVYHSALRQAGGDSHLAQDIVQSVFVLLAQKARDLRAHPSLAGWLHATTHFKVRETLRAERRRRIREEAAETVRKIMSDAAVEPDWERIRPMLDDVMLELADRDREAVLLRFFEGRPFAEIGTRLRLTENAAHKRVERALDKLRDRLARRDIMSSTAALTSVLGSQAGMAAPAGMATTVTGAVMAAPAPATAALTLIQFMSTTKATMASVAIALTFAGGIATHEIIASREAEAALATARQKHDELAANLRAAQIRAQEAGEERARIEDAIARQRAAQEAVGKGSTAPASSVGFSVLRDGNEILKAHPELKNTLVAIASVLFVALVATAFLAAHAKRRSEALLAVVMAKQAALQVEIRETKQTIAELERRRAELSDAAAHIAARHASPAPSNPQTQQRPKPPSFLELGRAYPELMDLFALSKRAELGQQYGPFFQALKLSPGQIEAFKDLRGERTARSGDIALAANELGIDPLDPIAAAVRQKEDEQINKPREIALLGEEG